MSKRYGMTPVHPGEILREELDALGLSANALAKALGVPVNRHHDDPERSAGHKRGHSAQTRTLFRDDAATLDEPPEVPGSFVGRRSSRDERLQNA